MKKVLKIIILLIVVIISVLLILKFIKKEHSTTYNIDKYIVEEKFYIENSNHFYDIVISNKKNNFIYTLNEKLNKNKKIIKKIKTYKKNDLICIVPFYKKQIKNTDIYCNYKNKPISSNYLIQTKSRDFNLILKKINKSYKKIKNPTTTEKKYKNISVYQKNIINDYKFIIWDYKGIYILSNEKLSYVKILKSDLYDNIMATIVDNYFVLFDNSSVNGIELIYYYDLKREKLKNLKITTKISKDSYINGVVNDLIYITDKKNKKQYSLNIKKEKLEEVGNEELSYQKYQNQNLELLSKSEFFKKNQYFNNEVIVDKIISSNDLRKENNYFYFLDNDNMYKALDKYKDKPILLFELQNISDWKIIGRDILLISDKTLYLYNESRGITKIVESNELKYNYKNICYLWKK